MTTTSKQIPEPLDVTVYKGDTWEEQLQGAIGAVPIDHTGCTFLLQVRKKLGGEVLETLTELDGISIAGVDNDIVSIKKVMDFEPGVWVWDIQITFPDGTVKTPRGGKFTLVNDVSKP